MSRILVGAALVVAALAGSAPARQSVPAGLVEQVTRALEEADPLAQGSTSPLLTADTDTWRAIFRIGADDTAPAVVRDRALRLEIADNRVQRIRDDRASPVHSPVWWLALDELDRGLPSGPRETMLERALPDEERRDAALTALSAARGVAARFCRDWNEIERNAEETARYAALRAELEEAGTAAIPYLATLLAVPPQATFTTLDEERGVTARQQVRALFALQFLGARSCLSYAVFHLRGPSFTQSAAARAVIAHLAKKEFPGADEAEQSEAIDAWYRDGRSGSWEREHFVRHALRWAREALDGDDPARRHAAGFVPRQLRPVVGELEFDPDAPLATRREQIARLERKAMLKCPVCIH